MEGGVYIFVGIIFLVLSAMKCYVYLRFLRHNRFIHRYISLGFLIVLAIGEVLPWQYFLVGSCVVLDYTLFIACVCVDIARFCFNLARKIVAKKRRGEVLESSAQSLQSTPLNTADSKISKAQERLSYESSQFLSSLSTSPIIESPCPAPYPSMCSQPISAPRRAFLHIIVDVMVGILFVCFSIIGFVSALSVPPVKRVSVRLPKLKRALRVAMITDVHIGKTLKGAFLAKVVERINALDADFVVIVGDLVDDKIHKIKDDLEPLRELKSRQGVYYVAGNHEYYHGLDPILAHLKTLNVRILHNTHIELDELNLAGVSDLAGLRFNYLPPDIESAKKDLNLLKPSVLLAHQPKFVRSNDVSEFDLVLCGHTHAGQVFPLSFFVWLDQKYIHGLYNVPSKMPKNLPTQLYVSSGVGFWGPAVRFLAQNEIVLLELEGV